MFRQPHHGAESRLEARVVQSEFIGLVRSTNILYVEDGFAWENSVEAQEDGRHVAVEVIDVEIRHAGKSR